MGKRDSALPFGNRRAGDVERDGGADSQPSQFLCGKADQQCKALRRAFGSRRMLPPEITHTKGNRAAVVDARTHGTGQPVDQAGKPCARILALAADRVDHRLRFANEYIGDGMCQIALRFEVVVDVSKRHLRPGGNVGDGGCRITAGPEQLCGRCRQRLPLAVAALCHRPLRFSQVT